MDKLVGLGLMCGSGAVIIFGALTGRLAAILAAFVKPEDLGPAGSGAPAAGSQENTTMQGDAMINALEAQARTWGINSNPKWKAAFDSQVKPLIAKALQSGDQADYDAAAAKLREINHQYKPSDLPGGKTTGPVPKGTPKTATAKSGKPLGGKARAPIVAKAPSMAKQ